MTENKPVARDTTPPNSEEEKWFEYANDLPFKSDEHLTNFAEKLLTLGSAGIGVYLLLVKLSQQPLNLFFWVPLFGLFGTLIFALLSIYPKKVDYESYEIKTVESNYSSGLEFRKKLLTIGFICYLISLFTASIVIMLT